MIGGVADIIGKIWNIPNDLIGLGVALAGGGQFAGFDNNAIQFVNNSLVSTAITIGNVINYGADYPPSAYGGDDNLIGPHEMQHTWQSQILGPLYLPLNLIGGIGGSVFNGAWHGPANFMEAGPQQHPPVPFPGW
jgi:hypothetical protein